MPNPDWMDEFTHREDLQLTDITMPASHDAGVSAVNYQSYTKRIPIFKKDIKTGPKRHTIAQGGNIMYQLMSGSRFFDLRLKKCGNRLRAYHDAKGVGGWGQYAKEIFEQVNNFLTAHNGEIVILRISHTTATVPDLLSLVGRLEARNLYMGARQLSKCPLSELRGKALVILDEDAIAETKPGYGLHRYQKYDHDIPVSTQGMSICGKYAGIWFKSITDVAYTTIDAINEHTDVHNNQEDKPDHMFIIYWQLAFDIKNKTKMNGFVERERGLFPLKKIQESLSIHANLSYLLSLYDDDIGTYNFVTRKTGLGKGKTIEFLGGVRKRNMSSCRPNIINLDFIDDKVCEMIIDFNGRMLPEPPN